MHNVIVQSYATHTNLFCKVWVLKSQPRHTQVVKTGTDRSTAKHWATDVTITGPRRIPISKDVPCDRLTVGLTR